MKAQPFLSHLRQTFNLPFDRAMKHGTALRGMGLLPDGRRHGLEQHVTCSQAANAIVLFGVNPFPGASTYENTIVDYVSLPDFSSELADLLKDAGIKIYSEGVTRVSISISRPFACIICEPPGVKKVLTDSGSSNWRVREHEKTFGSPDGKRSVEQFTFVKRSALIAISQCLANVGSEREPDEILSYINQH
jgi:hypothetical protein